MATKRRYRDESGRGRADSTTNLPEQGVDEADVVKTDGKRIVAVAHQTLRIVRRHPPRTELVGSLKLDGIGQQLLVRGNRVLVIASPAPRSSSRWSASGGWTLIPPVAAARVAPIVAGRQQTIRSKVDNSNLAAPKVAGTMTVDGQFVDARQNGGTTLLVVDDATQPVAEPQEADTTAFVGSTVLRSLSGHTLPPSARHVPAPARVKAPTCSASSGSFCAGDDPHAFLPAGPDHAHDPRRLHLTGSGTITQPAGDQYGPTPIDPALVVGDHLYTVSNLGLQSYRLGDLGPESFTRWASG